MFECITHSALSCNISSSVASRVVADLLFVSSSSFWASAKLLKQKKSEKFMFHVSVHVIQVGGYKWKQNVQATFLHIPLSVDFYPLYPFLYLYCLISLRLTLLWQSPTSGEWSTAQCPSCASRYHERQRAPWSSDPFPLNPDNNKWYGTVTTTPGGNNRGKCLELVGHFDVFSF